MPKHRSGGKCSGSHTTITDGAAVVVDAAQRDQPVSRIALGVIRRCVSRKRRLVFKDISAGWEIDVVDNASIQTLYVYTSDKTATRDVLFRSWPGY